MIPNITFTELAASPMETWQCN